MCAIGGLIDTRGRAVDQKTISRMMHTQAHRGPDGTGVYTDGNIGLGHCRLSIIDLSDAGTQPMHSADGRYTLVFNGEIYNYKELRKELGKRAWKGSSDSEVLLAAYEKWGASCVKKFNGIFAFAIWDKKKKELFCARDHVGVKPFYYSFNNGRFIFASEIKGVLAAGVRAKPNESYMYDFLTHGYYHHRSAKTFFDGIAQLPQGHTLLLTKKGLEIRPFWDLAAEAKNQVARLVHASDADIEKEFFTTFEDAIKLQLRSDVPVGLQLSGGFDSSAVTGMVHHVLGGQKNARLFSFVYGNYADKEISYMRSLARGLGWKLEITHVLPKDMQNLMERAVWHAEEPFPGLPTFGQFLLAEKCREEGIPVILGGQGGDEIGTGYEYYLGAYFYDMLRDRGAPAALKELETYAKRAGLGDKERLAFFARALSAYLYGGTSADGTSFVVPSALNPAFAKRAQQEKSVFTEPFSSALANMQYRDIVATKLPRILHGADRSAMAYGIEHRVPLLDYRLVTLGLALPDHAKIRDGVQRYYMREATKHIVPARVRNAPKRAVPSPQREWFKTELQPWVRSILASKSFKSRPYFNQKEVLAEYDRYCATSGVPKNSFHIWQWIFFEIWLRKYFD
jgi:asparagine synthase (glutamine-hydrolysing)